MKSYERRVLQETMPSRVEMAAVKHAGIDIGRSPLTSSITNAAVTRIGLTVGNTACTDFEGSDVTVGAAP